MQVYLLASFPSLRPDGPLPFPFEKLFSECARHLSPSDLDELDAVTSEPPSGTRAFAREWIQAREQLDSTNRRQRLRRLPGEEPLRVPRPEPDDALRGDLAAAWDQQDPLARETALMLAQWKWIEERRRRAPLSLDDLFGYSLQLKLLERRDGWDDSEGQTQFNEHIDSFLEPVLEELSQTGPSA